MSIRIKSFLIYMYYKEIWLNPYLPNKFLLLYRIILGLLFIYSVMNNNLSYVLYLLDIYSIDYYNELLDDCIFVHMDSLDGGLNYDTNNLSSGNLLSGGGPSGGGPSGNNPLGLIYPGENENSRQRFEDIEFKMSKRKRRPDGPKFKYYNRYFGKNIYPEKFHTEEPEYFASNTMRVYNEGGIRYTYICDSYHSYNRYCRIRYPDGTYTFIFDKPLVLKHIEFHRKHIALGYGMKPPFMYPERYQEHFDQFRKNKINAFFERENNDHLKRKKITINEILNSDNENNIDTSKKKTMSIDKILNS